MTRRVSLLLIACVLLVGLQGCGKRGDLLRESAAREAVHYG
jgi:predicted small lipoprotein YifL